MADPRYATVDDMLDILEQKHELNKRLLDGNTHLVYEDDHFFFCNTPHLPCDYWMRVLRACNAVRQAQPRTFFAVEALNYVARPDHAWYQIRATRLVKRVVNATGR
jgi:hypothetical protein